MGLIDEVSGAIGEVMSSLVKEEDGEHSIESVADPGSGANMTTDHSSAPGDDSPPFASDLIVMMRVPGSENYVAVGYIDAKNKSLADHGEKRLYARDSDGNPVSIVWLKKDGSVRINNGEDWAVQFTAMKAAFDELKGTLNTIQAHYIAHTHAVSGAATATPLPPPLPTAATADMSGAKVEKVRLP